MCRVRKTSIYNTKRFKNQALVNGMYYVKLVAATHSWNARDAHYCNVKSLVGLHNLMKRVFCMHLTTHFVLKKIKVTPLK